MKFLLVLCLGFTLPVVAQNNKKEDKKLRKDLERSITYLSDDKLEGRRTGSKGEKLAYEFITEEFKDAGLTPAGTNGYLQPFTVNDGKTIKNTELRFGSKNLVAGDDYFPLSNSVDAKFTSVDAASDVMFLDLEKTFSENSTNVHFDVHQHISEIAKKAEASGRKALFVYNNSATKDDISFVAKSKAEALAVPVIYLRPSAGKTDPSSIKDVELSLDIDEESRTGHNVIGIVNNKANYTIVLGAHYDHLGYGEDHNSLYSGKEKMIHNGADDNASGTAALIELASWLKRSGPKKYNYLLVAFSGEELGLYGSKYFIDNSPVEINKISYMINMDMIGRMNETTHGLTIGGYGTSPSWPALIGNGGSLNIKFDSSGTGPSDHTSFYRKDIPVLFFFTGTHMDYHKPTDDADRINYDGAIAVINLIKNIISNDNNSGKLAFTKTREAATVKSSFKVSLGIMPDYTFSGTGVLVEGVSEGRAAQKAGIKAGDVLLQLGEHKFTDVMSYMSALNKFNKGESTVVKIKRGSEEIALNVIF